MIIKLKHNKNTDVTVFCESNRFNIIQTEVIDDFYIDIYDIKECNSFYIEAYSKNKKPFNIKLFKKNWYDGIKSSIVSFDCFLKKQTWNITCESKRNAKIDIEIQCFCTDNILNGVLEYNNLLLKDSRNVKITSVKNIERYSKEKLIMSSLMFANLIPLILLIIVFLYTDIVHPEWFRSGTLYIFIADIPLIIILLINFIRYTFYMKKINSIIYYIKSI